MRSKFLAIVVPIALAAIVIVFGVFEYVSIQRAEANLRHRLNSLLTVQSSALAGSIWTINEQQVRLTVDALMSDPDIVLVKVYDFSDSAGFQDLYEAENPDAQTSFVGEADIFNESAERRSVIGKLIIGVSDERIVAEARLRLFLVASLAIALLICVVGSILFSYRRIIETPLGRLLDGIRASKIDTHSTAVEWTSSDEMGKVIAAFNEMLHERAAHERELRLSKDRLEERVQARTNELAIVNRQLSEAIESTSEGFSLFDSDDRLIVCNTKYKQLLKPDAGAEELARSFPPGTSFLEILRFAANSGILDIPAGQEVDWIEEQLRQRRSPGGRFVQLQINGQWIRIAERTTHDGSIVAVYSNVTELEHARIEAEAASEAKSTFLATMSHEIRTPMNGVLGMLEVLERSPLDDEQRHMTETITKSATSLLAIIDDILDFSKIEADGIEIERIATPLREVCESAMTLIAPEAEQKGLDLALIVEPDVAPSIYTDPLRLRQILINLLGNAVKFTAAGSIVVRVKRISGDNGERIRFSVTDTGVGIAKDQLSQIFSPFSQAESSTIRKYGGTGLGLAISKRLIENMNGRIGVISESGEGATFWFTLPLEPAEQTKDNLVHEFDFSAKDALVVTASPVVYEMIEKLLAECGARVHHAASPAEAEVELMAAKLRSTPFDLVIIDGRLSFEEFERLPALAGQKARSGQSGICICAGYDIFGGDPKAVSSVYRDRQPGRNSLLRAAGIVLGLASPDHEAISQPDDDVTPSEPIFANAVPSISDAIDTTQLILIVDDHETNRDVIQRQLTAIGYGSHIAGDGEEALAMWRQTPYALVLCDCHMPVLDGFGLTSAIRSAEAKSGSRTPIVALTANALLGEADLCLNAGMDDYLSKPVGIQKLRDTLVRWIGQPRQKRSSANHSETPGSNGADCDSDDNPFDLEFWSEISGEGNLDGLREIVGKLKVSLSDTVNELHQLQESGSLTDIAEAAHKGAGAAGSVAAIELSYSFKRLENAAKAGRTDDIAPLFGCVESEVERVMSWNL